MLEIAALILFPALMAFAAFSDLFTMTIANWISAALIVSFAVLAFAAGMPAAEIVVHFACGAAVLAITFGLFACGWIGGGDAKLAATTALWMGFPHIAEYGLLTSAIGLALTIAIVQLRRLPLPRVLHAQAWLSRLHQRDNGVPYGIALAIAGVMLYPDTQIWSTLTAH